MKRPNPKQSRNRQYKKAQLKPYSSAAAAQEPLLSRLLAERRNQVPLIMGILNVTPDSFSDGGLYIDSRKALERAMDMADGGADILDIGGESTRPGAKAISAAEELKRVMPVIEALVKRVDLPISVDTRKSQVAAQALRAGASIINDVSGLRYDPKMAAVVARAGVSVVLMHMRGTPSDMRKKAVYRNLLAEVVSEIKVSIRIARRAGISREAIVIDPGLGFAKTASQNFEILKRLRGLKSLGYPVCIGASRKSFIRQLAGEGDIESLKAGTVASAVCAALNGADIVRVHDVSQTRAALNVVERIMIGA